MPCMGLLTVDEFLEPLRDLNISERVARAPISFSIGKSAQHPPIMPHSQNRTCSGRAQTRFLWTTTLAKPNPSGTTERIFADHTEMKSSWFKIACWHVQQSLQYYKM